MAKTEKKEIFIDLSKVFAADFLDSVKIKLKNLISFNIRMSKPNQVSILLKGPRERINYAMTIIKNIMEEKKKPEEN